MAQHKDQATVKTDPLCDNGQGRLAGFYPACRPLLLGSMPGRDHVEAVTTVMRYTPDIPSWPQLPEYENESLLQQFLPGLPGLRSQTDTRFEILVDNIAFADEVAMFYKEYQSVIQGACPHEMSRFVLDDSSAKGFHILLQFLERDRPQIISLKGQIVGPATFLSSLRDKNGIPLYENKALRECAVILLALKAQYQTRLLGRFTANPILFLDEPMLFNFGRFGSDHLSYEKLLAMYSFIFEKIEQEQGITGIHVCADTDWRLIFESGVTTISFDAYSYCESLFFYEEQLREHLMNGKFLAFGLVPTSEQLLQCETCESLVQKFICFIDRFESMGVDRQRVFQQGFITPTCGTGRTSPALSSAIYAMTRKVSKRIRTFFLDQNCH